MNKTATTLDEQIVLLSSRGVEITCIEKAKECLLDIGYFRLCSYLFPFEKSYPRYKNRTHEVIDGTKLSDAVALYYFDFDLRNILNRYISRIEVSLRTYITYTISNKYKLSPTWFADPEVMNSSYVGTFQSVYDAIMKKPVIKRHHSKYVNDQYAPAWKIFTSILNPLLTNWISAAISASGRRLFSKIISKRYVPLGISAHMGEYCSI